MCNEPWTFPHLCILSVYWFAHAGQEPKCARWRTSPARPPTPALTPTVQHLPPMAACSSSTPAHESKFLNFSGFVWNLLSWVMEVADVIAIVLPNRGGKPLEWLDFVGVITLLVIMHLLPSLCLHRLHQSQPACCTGCVLIRPSPWLSCSRWSHILQ